jgi:hypothetical protein
MNEQQAYLANLEDQLGVVAMQIAERAVGDDFLRDVEGRVGALLCDLDRAVLHEQGALDPEDSTALRAAVVAEVERAVYLALAVYTAHVAETLGREVEQSTTPYSIRPIPAPSGADIDALVRHGAAYGAALKELPRMLASYEGDLPPLGRIAHGRLVPSREQVEAWLRSRNGGLRPRITSAKRAERHAALAALGRK